MARLFSDVRFLDPQKHERLNWECLKSRCPSSCCNVPDRTFVVLEELAWLSKYFPIVITVEVDNLGREEKLLCAYFRLKEDKKGCVYLKEGLGCLIEEEKPYTCRQYPFLIRGNYLAADFTCPGFSQDVGTPVWNKASINPYFERDFFLYSLKLEEGKAQTEEFLKALFDLDLIVGGKLTYETIDVSFNMVDEERLLELPKDILREFYHRGYLRFVYAHLNSLQNWEKLIRRYLKP